MSEPRSRDIQRLTVAAALVLAAPLYVRCGLLHVCIGGHMLHAPGSVFRSPNDLAWIGLFVLAGILCWKRTVRLRKTLFVTGLLLVVSRIGLGSGGGFLFLVELPLLTLLVVAAILNLFGGARDWSQAPLEERKVHRKAVRRGWGVALGSLVAVGLLAWGSISEYWFVRRTLTPKIEVSNVPFSKE